MEMVDMRIVVPPGQQLPKVLAHVSIDRAEAVALRDALDLVQAKGRSDWSVNIDWSGIEGHLTLMLEMAVPGNSLHPV
jgi:hypothetical protein